MSRGHQFLKKILNFFLQFKQHPWLLIPHWLQACCIHGMEFALWWTYSSELFPWIIPSPWVQVEPVTCYWSKEDGQGDGCHSLDLVILFGQSSGMLWSCNDPVLADWKKRLSFSAGLGEVSCYGVNYPWREPVVSSKRWKPQFCNCKEFGANKKHNNDISSCTDTARNK